MPTLSDCNCWLPEGDLESCPYHGPLIAAAESAFRLVMVRSIRWMDECATNTTPPTPAAHRKGQPPLLRSEAGKHEKGTNENGS